MATTEARDIDRQCLQKWAYRSKAEARIDLRRLHAKGTTHAAGGTKVLTIYKCPWSAPGEPHFHAGHKVAPTPTEPVSTALRPPEKPLVERPASSASRLRNLKDHRRKLRRELDEATDVALRQSIERQIASCETRIAAVLEERADASARLEAGRRAVFGAASEVA
ncbi:MAG: hypothetical protein ACYCTE_06775 [Acidimicrobiales bacterium]